MTEVNEEKMKLFMRSFPDDADVSKIMLSFFD